MLEKKIKASEASRPVGQSPEREQRREGREERGRVGQSASLLLA
jgi:hypothetical protein